MLDKVLFVCPECHTGTMVPLLSLESTCSVCGYPHDPLAQIVKEVISRQKSMDQAPTNSYDPPTYPEPSYAKAPCRRCDGTGTVAYFTPMEYATYKYDWRGRCPECGGRG